MLSLLSHFLNLMLIFFSRGNVQQNRLPCTERWLQWGTMFLQQRVSAHGQQHVWMDWWGALCIYHLPDIYTAERRASDRLNTATAITVNLVLQLQHQVTVWMHHGTWKWHCRLTYSTRTQINVKLCNNKEYLPKVGMLPLVVERLWNFIKREIMKLYQTLQCFILRLFSERCY